LAGLQRDTASTNWSGLKIYDDAIAAISREKELKKWRQDWKIRLIEEQNPEWVDLYPGICN
jgi:putative endonuclease